MWYINAGYTQADVDFTFTLNNVTVPGSRNDVTLGGWFIGGGVEQQLGRGFALSMEYRYANYDVEGSLQRFVHDGRREPMFHREELDPTIHTVRLGLTYKFDVHNRAAAVPLK